MRTLPPSTAPTALTALVTLALLAWLAAPAPASAQLSRDEQKCVRALNGGLLRVAGAQGKEASRCVQLEAKGKLGGTVEGCLVADARGKVAKAEQKTLSDEGRKCATALAFGPQDGAEVNAAGREAALDLGHDLLGPNADGAVLAKGADRAGAACQKALLKAAQGCLAAKLRDFLDCKKSGLEAGAIASASDLAACLGQDLRGRIAKACDDADRPDKLRRALERKCLAKGVELTVALPPCGASGDAQATHACLEPRIECRACRAVSRADALSIDCDLFDDGTSNASCPDDPTPPPPAANDVHLPVVLAGASLANDVGPGSPRGPPPTGFGSYYQVQNLESTAASVSVTYYAADGSVAATDSTSVPGDGVVGTFPSSVLASGFVGSARLSSSSQIAVAATLESFEDGFRGAAYRGQRSSEASTGLVLPSVGCNRAGFSTTFYLQNVGSGAANVTVDYVASGSGDDLTHPLTIPASGLAVGAGCTQLGGVSGTFDGYATITSDQPLLAAAFDHAPGTGGSLLSHGATSPADTLYLPLVRSDFSGAFSGILIQNVGAGAGTVDVAYGANQVPGGNAAAPVATTVPTGGRLALTPSVIGPYAGAATVTATQPLVALVDELDSLHPARRSAFAGLTANDVGDDVAVPIVFGSSNDFTTSVACQALAPNVAISVEYTENLAEPGEVPAIESANLAAAGDSVTFVQSGGQWATIGPYVGAARIDATDAVACAVRIDGPTAMNDSSYVYLPIILR